MLSHGDEIGRTQRGNNNAYCQDNELTWLDWELDASARELLAFTRGAFALFHAPPGAAPASLLPRRADPSAAVRATSSGCGPTATR